MLCGTDNIPHNIPIYAHVWTQCGKYMEILCGILSVPHNTIIDLNNVMNIGFSKTLL